jgi:hypothetical protein
MTKGANLRGGTGIGNIGIVFNNDEERLFVRLGLEGYAGKRDGGGASVSLTYRW